MGARGPKPGTVKKTGGRKKGTPNKATADVKAVAREHTAAMIAELVRLATEAESEAARVAAIKEVLDRGHGKSPQAMTVDPGDTFAGMLKTFLGSIDGNSRGLPRDRAPLNGSGVAPGQSVLHPGRSGANGSVRPQ